MCSWASANGEIAIYAPCSFTELVRQCAWSSVAGIRAALPLAGLRHGVALTSLRSRSQTITRECYGPFSPEVKNTAPAPLNAPRWLGAPETGMEKYKQ